MSAYKQQLKKEILEAIIFLRENNHTIPSETLEFMKAASLEKVNPKKELVTFWFDCWNRKGKTFSKDIQAECPEDAKIIFEARHPNLAFDEPFY